MQSLHRAAAIRASSTCGRSSSLGHGRSARSWRPPGWRTLENRAVLQLSEALPRGVRPRADREAREREKPRRAGLLEVRRRGLEPPPGYPGPGPQPDSGGVLSVQTALDRHIPSAGEDDPDGEDDADVPKSVLTNPPQRARSRVGRSARPPCASARSPRRSDACDQPEHFHGKRLVVKTALRDDTLVWLFGCLACFAGVLLHLALRLGTSFRVRFRRLRPPRAVPAQYEIVSPARWRSGPERSVGRSPAVAGWPSHQPRSLYRHRRRTCRLGGRARARPHRPAD